MESKFFNPNRFMGQETEYALLFLPKAHQKRPSNYQLFQKLKAIIESLVKTKTGYRYYHDHFYMENGGSFNYEFIPKNFEFGLFEAATPECSSPRELLLYQRAQEALLEKALSILNLSEKEKGRTGLIKNCRDVKGNIYGAQENYETEIASGFKLFFYRLGILLALPLWIATLTLLWILVFNIFILFLVGYLGLIIFFQLSYHSFRFFQGILKLNIFEKASDVMKKFIEKISMVSSFFNLEEDELSQEKDLKIKSFLFKMDYKIIFPFQLLIFFPLTIFLKWVAFSRQRKALTPFIISRPIVTGAGTLLEEGIYALSEKAPSMKRLTRFSIAPNDRAVYDFGNILKDFHFAGIDLLFFRFSRLKGLLSKRQRFQLGFSDSNRAQVAEYLKWGTTLLVLDMVEAGFLKDAPKVISPVNALKKLIMDPSLKEKVKTKKRGMVNALEIQHYYLMKAEAFLKNKKEVSLEYYEIITLWRETLKGLEEDPGRLIGRIDWVTKRYLLETSGENGSFEVKKRIDIGYHELGKGYYDTLERKGIALNLLNKEEIIEASTKPSSPHRVKMRSKIIRDLMYQGERIFISWNSVRIGNFRNRKIVYLDSLRDNGQSSNDLEQ